MTRKNMRTPHLMALPIVILVVIFLFIGSRLSSIIFNDRSTHPSTTADSEQSDKKRLDGDGLRKRMPVDSEPANEKAADAKRTTVRYCDTDVGQCIFDVGLNAGQDTKQYLASSSAARVVAIEANPTLIDDAKKKFQDEIKAGRLKLVNIGLVGNETESKETRPKVTFWINKLHDPFSSFKQQGGCRGPGGVFLPKGNTTFCRKIEMNTMSCSELVMEYGTPSYMKVDIEGMDRACVQALGNIAEKDRPKYISKENVWLPDIEIFTTLGYRWFKVVNQNVLQRNVWGTDLIGHSGPWGEDAEDMWKGKKWQSRKEAIARLPLPELVEVNGKKVKGWYDLHGKK